MGGHRRRRTDLSIYIFLLFILSDTSAHAQGAIVLQAGQASYPLGPELRYLEDKDGKHQIADISSAPLIHRFKRSTSKVPNFGFTRSAYWFYVDVKNAQNVPSTYFLDLAYPLIDRLDLYLEQPDKRFVKRLAGDTYPHGNKEMRALGFVFPLRLGPGQTRRIYLRAQTRGSLQLPLTLWTRLGLQETVNNRLIAYGIYFGIFIFVFVYNLFILLAIRERIYLYYVFYILFVLVYQGTLEGLAQEYLWPAWPRWGNTMMPFSLSGTWFFSVLFAQQFLKLKENVPLANKVLSVVLVLAAINLIGSFFLPYNLTTLAAAVGPGLTACLIPVIAAVTWRRGFKPARLYLAAWIVWLLGIVLLASSKLAVLPSSVLTDKAHMFGFALNAVLLSLALADRINIMKEEKAQAQTQALQAQRQAAEMLEQEIDRKTQDLQIRNQELERATQRLTEHDRLKSNFFANVSHELRTPLSLILTPLQRLLESRVEKLPVDVTEKLRSIAGNTQRLLRLVNQLLDFSRLESGGMEVAYQQVHVRALVEPVVAAFEPFAQSKGIQLELFAPDELPRAYVDVPKLEKVTSNLLSNACKFTDSGGKVAVILDSDDRWLTLAVKDSGIGIAEEDLPKIFERFRQLDAGTSRRFEGTGIGLALSKELVELTGGQLTVKSVPGFGSTFTVRLPLGSDHIQDPALIRGRDSEEELASPLQADATAVALAAEQGLLSKKEEPDQPPGDALAAEDGRPLLLIVEDNPDLRALVAEICQDAFRVVQAGDGQQGLELIHQHRPSLVIADVMMPRMDGHEMLRRIRADPQVASTPVMLVTAKAGAETRLEGLEGGADDYLVKPFEARELLARAGNFVRLQRQRRQLSELHAKLQQEVMQQSHVLERARLLGRYLPPEVVRSIVEQQVDAPGVDLPQHRQGLTVFLLELRGFDELVEAFEPEEMAAAVSVYLSEMTELAFAHGATVDKLVRDTVLGFFGAPKSAGPEQDALRCTRLAIAMWRRAVELCEQWSELAGGRMAVPTLALTSGLATVGVFGVSNRLEYTAIGGPVDEAHHLLSALESGEVACSQSTWSLIQSEIEGDAVGETAESFRGRRIKLYRLAGPLEIKSREQQITADIKPLAAAEQPTPSDIEPSATGKLRKGQILAERYQVASGLDTGDARLVYLANDLKLSTRVAIRLLPPHEDTDPHERSLLYRDVRRARLVRHPNVQRIYDIGEWQGREFISMEHLEGQTLRERIQTGGALTYALGLDILIQLCSGLGAAHAAGIVHRKLTPSHIILEPGGRVVIAELGLSLFDPPSTADGPSDPSEDTLDYLAPEVLSSGSVDHRTDIYSVGAITLEMFTGQRHVRTDASSVDPLTSNPDLPPRLAAVIGRCLEKQLHRRLDSAQEILAFLDVDPDRAGERPIQVDR